MTRTARISILVLTATLLRTAMGSKPAQFGIALMAAGGAGNLIDRVFNDGAVIDFVSIGFAGLRTGIFNIADVSIIAGVLLFAPILRRTSR